MKANTMPTDQQLIDYLMSNGAEKFWAHTAFGWMRRAFAGNHYFVTGMSKPTVTVKSGYVSRFACSVDVCLPNSEKQIKGRLIYTFKPEQKVSHKVEVKGL